MKLHDVPSDESIIDVPVTGRALWRSGDCESTHWIWHFETDELAELDAALRRVQRHGLALGQFGRDDFPLPALGTKLAAIRNELVEGVRFALIRNLPVERYSVSELELLFWGIGSHIGSGIVQNAAGALLTHVTHHNLDPKNPHIRGYQDRRRQEPHNDLADVVGLLCVRKARSGGESSIVNSYAIYNEFLRHRPDLLHVCYRGFHLDYRGEGDDPNATTSYRIPLFSSLAGKLFVFYGRRGIEAAMKKRGEQAAADERAALDLLDQIIAEKDLRLDMQLEPGDTQFVNNYSVLHARTAYEDYPDPQRWRLLLRLWLNLPEIQLPSRLARFTRAGFGELAPAQKRMDEAAASPPET